MPAATASAAEMPGAAASTTRKLPSAAGVPKTINAAAGQMPKATLTAAADGISTAVPVSTVQVATATSGVPKSASREAESATTTKMQAGTGVQKTGTMASTGRNPKGQPATAAGEIPTAATTTAIKRVVSGAN